MRPNACRATANGPGSAFPELVGNADNATHDGNTPSNSPPRQPCPDGRPDPTQFVIFIPAASRPARPSRKFLRIRRASAALLLADQPAPRRAHHHHSASAPGAAHASAGTRHRTTAAPRHRPLDTTPAPQHGATSPSPTPTPTRPSLTHPPHPQPPHPHLAPAPDTPPSAEPTGNQSRRTAHTSPPAPRFTPSTKATITSVHASRTVLCLFLECRSDDMAHSAFWCSCSTTAASSGALARDRRQRLIDERQRQPRRQRNTRPHEPPRLTGGRRNLLGHRNRHPPRHPRNVPQADTPPRHPQPPLPALPSAPPRPPPPNATTPPPRCAPTLCRATATGPGSAFPELVGNADNATHDGNTPSNSPPRQPRPDGRPDPTHAVTFVPATLRPTPASRKLLRIRRASAPSCLADQRTSRRDHRHVRRRARHTACRAPPPRCRRSLPHPCPRACP